MRILYAYMVNVPNTISGITKEEKLAILGMAARYDASCSSSGSTRKNQDGTGNAARMGICHSWADDGRCISLLKVLQSNACSYDCAYCVNRRSNDIPRATFSSEELSEITMQFYKRNYIEGLFLSSAVFRSSDYSMELMLRTVQLLRKNHRFGGYIHMKVMPGADQKLIAQAGFFADRISANIELPTAKSLEFLAPDKAPSDILGSIKDISHKIRDNADERKQFKKAGYFAPAGQSTQLIVGATGDTDRTIVTLSESLYRKLSLKRVYYSAYIPMVTDPRIPMIVKPPLMREHRLYQADWLLRFYKFTADEILSDAHPNLEMEIDPKAAWALRNYQRFPIEINRASYDEILRVPGIGVMSAQRIIRARSHNALTFEHLKKLGIVLKRAQYFILCSGKAMHRSVYPEAVRADLVPGKSEIRRSELHAGQLPLFRAETNLLPIELSQEI
jgi:putative DNA modification/repair radical SAM protein